MTRNRLAAFDGPWNLFDQLQREMTSTLAEPGRGVPTNVWTDEDRATIALEVPGLDAEAIDVAVDKDLVTVRGERAADEADGRGVIRERSRGRFARSVRLPFEAEADGVTASYERGVLLVTVPKAEAAKPTRVPVLAAN